MNTSYQNPHIEGLRRNLHHLAVKDHGFAKSLIDQWEGKGRLSPKQWEWVEKLEQRAEERSKPTLVLAATDGVRLDDMSGLLTLFDKAREAGTQRPKIKFAVDDKLIRLAWHPKGLYINLVGEDWDSTITLGRINADTGILHKWDRWDKDAPAGLLDAIRELVANPSAFGRAQGQRLKWCIFCGSELRTTDSLFYGYGPICASKFGLEWGNAAEHIVEQELEQLP